MANKYTKMRLDLKRIKELYESGMTQIEVGQEIGVTQKVIYARLKEIGIKCRKAAPRNQKTCLNNNWRGRKAGYSAFHRRLEAQKGRPIKCERCGTNDPSRTYDWANLTGRYDDPGDYQRLCRSCHWRLDGKHKNFKGATGGRRAVIKNA